MISLDSDDEGDSNIRTLQDVNQQPAKGTKRAEPEPAEFDEDAPPVLKCLCDLPAKRLQSKTSLNPGRCAQAHLPLQL